MKKSTDIISAQQNPYRIPSLPANTHSKAKYRIIEKYSKPYGYNIYLIQKRYWFCWITISVCSYGLKGAVDQLLGIKINKQRSKNKAKIVYWDNEE